MCDDVSANKSLYGNERETPSIRSRLVRGLATRCNRRGRYWREKRFAAHSEVALGLCARGSRWVGSGAGARGWGVWGGRERGRRRRGGGGAWGGVGESGGDRGAGQRGAGDGRGAGCRRVPDDVGERWGLGAERDIRRVRRWRGHDGRRATGACDRSNSRGLAGAVDGGAG